MWVYLWRPPLEIFAVFIGSPVQLGFMTGSHVLISFNDSAPFLFRAGLVAIGERDGASLPHRDLLTSNAITGPREVEIPSLTSY